MNKKAKSIGVLLLVLGALIAAVGCGGSDSTGASITKSQFVKKTDAICEKAEGEQLKLATEYLKKNPGTEEEELIVPAGLPPIQEQAEKIEALPVPEGDEAQIEAYLDAVDEGIKDTEANPGKALKADSNPFDKANSLAEEYGMTICAGLP